MGDFLSPEEHKELLRLVVDPADFAPAQVTEPGAVAGSANPNLRSAQVGTVTDEVFALFEDKLEAMLPHARREIQVPHFELGRIERQATAHDHGDFFSAHTDVGDPTSEGASRRVSYVYYFHEQPRQFEGGELVVYDTHIDEAGVVTAAETYQLIEPADNSIVFFPSTVMHEVRPVKVTGEPGTAGTTRFTVNGWFHDRNHERAEPHLDPPIRTALTQRYTPSFTEHGFKKIATPAAVHRAMRAAYDARFDHRRSEAVDAVHLPSGTPDFIDIEDVKGQFHFALQSVHEEWAGVELEPTAVYGLRVYRRGHTLIPHTDRLRTHVISSIAHIAHETDEPWPLWITDLHGNEHEVVLEEGEMLLYESARCPHARPKPLNGDAYCSLFLHYRPIDWDVTIWSLIEQARADEAWHLLPPELRLGVPQTGETGDAGSHAQ